MDPADTAPCARTRPAVALSHTPLASERFVHRDARQPREGSRIRPRAPATGQSNSDASGNASTSLVRGAPATNRAGCKTPATVEHDTRPDAKPAVQGRAGVRDLREARQPHAGAREASLCRLREGDPPRAGVRDLWPGRQPGQAARQSRVQGLRATRQAAPGELRRCRDLGHIRRIRAYLVGSRAVSFSRRSGMTRSVRWLAVAPMPKIPPSSGPDPGSTRLRPTPKWWRLSRNSNGWSRVANGRVTRADCSAVCS